MKVKRGLIKGAGTETVAEPVATASSAEGATASPAPAEGATASTAPGAASAASAGEANASTTEGQEAKANGEGVEGEANASTTEGQEAKAEGAANGEGVEGEAAEAEEEITKKLIEVNAFMKEFFESFDDTNKVVEKTKFPEYSSNLGKLSEKIINANRKKHIIDNIKILDNYRTFLTKILS